MAGRYDIEMREGEALDLEITLYETGDDGESGPMDLAGVNLRGRIRYGPTSDADAADAAIRFEDRGDAFGHFTVATDADHGLGAGVYWYELELAEAGTPDRFVAFLAGRLVVEAQVSD